MLLEIEERALRYLKIRVAAPPPNKHCVSYPPGIAFHDGATSEAFQTIAGAYTGLPPTRQDD